MKLLFDENLSPKLAPRLADIFPGSAHVRELGLERSNDLDIWEFAKQRNYLIVTKDSDFNDVALVRGFPPHVVWLRYGNCRVADMEGLIRRHSVGIHDVVAGNKYAIIELFD